MSKKTTLTPAPASVGIAENTEEIALVIKRDLQGMEVGMRNASVHALRVGILLIAVREKGRGSLEQFKRAHFAPKVSRTLENYIRIAEQCLKDTGMFDKRTRALNNGDIAAVTGAQMELFTSSELATTGKGNEDAIKRVTDWIDGRGIWEILQDVRKSTAKSTPPRGSESEGEDDEPVAKVSVREVKRKAMWDTVCTFQQQFAAKHWMYLDKGDLTSLSHLLNKAQVAVGAQLKKLEQDGKKSLKAPTAKKQA